MEQEALENYKKAGKIAAEALEFGKSLIKKDASILEVTQSVHKKIRDLGGELAFPINISMNEQAAHNTAKIADDFRFSDEVVKLDVGVHIDGYIGDTALTVDLSGKYTDLVNASRDALNNAIKICKPGTTLGEIGKVIEDTITSAGFVPVKNLSGHEIQQWVLHSGMHIPNFDTEEDTKLEEDMVIAIEPFATNGLGLIEDKGNPEIFMLLDFKPVRINFVRQIMEYVSGRQTLPFSKQMLSEKFSLAQINFALKQFENLEILKEYKPLVEKKLGFVSQAEHTVLVKDQPLILTKI